MEESVKARIAGFKAAASSVPRLAPTDLSVSLAIEWLGGYDGHAEGVAENYATKLRLDAENVATPHAKRIIYRASGTPRTLHLNTRDFWSKPK